MSKTKRFEETPLWKSSRNLVQRVCAVSKSPLFFSDYCLRDQIRRAAVSIASNVAEGFDGQSAAVTCRYLASALGSAAEVRAQLYLALDLGYLPQTDFDMLLSICESISRQLSGFISYLKKHRKQEDGL